MSVGHTNNSSLLRGTGIVGAFTLLSRLIGFVRDLLVARLFGSGLFADAFYVAFRIPNLLRSVVAEGAFTSAFVPIFSGELAKGKTQARLAFQEISGLLIIATTLLTILGVLFAEPIVTLFAPGFESIPGKTELSITLTRIMMPYIIFVSFVALLGGVLNSMKIFGTAAFAQVVMNMVLVGGALIAALYAPELGVRILAYSVLAGGIAQVLVQVPPLIRVDLLVRPALRFFTPITKELLKLMLPALLGSAIYQVTIFLNTLLASLLDPGSVSWLYYADRLIQLPIGIFSIALATVLLPLLSGASARGEHADFSATLGNSLRYTSFVIMPIAVFIFAFAPELIAILFQRGAFSPHDTEMASAAVQAMSIGLWFTSCHSMLVRSLMAKKDTLSPSLIGLGALLVNIPVALFFMGPPAHQEGFGGTLLTLQHTLGFDQFGANFHHIGLGLASSLSSAFAFSAAILLVVSRKGLDLDRFVASSWRSLLGALPIVWIPNLLVNIGHPLTRAILALPLAAITYFAITLVFKSQETQETLALIRRTIRR